MGSRQGMPTLLNHGRSPVNTIQVLLVAATLLCSLTAGFLFAFAVVVMPGIVSLDDRAFVRAFQVMDGIIQDNSPLFIVVWVGSLVALAAGAVVGLTALSGTPRVLLIAAAAIYLVGVQLPTFIVNIPLNNATQAVDVETVSPEKVGEARRALETRWIRWNVIRTGLAVLTTGLLLVVLLMV